MGLAVQDLISQQEACHRGNLKTWLLCSKSQMQICPTNSSFGMNSWGGSWANLPASHLNGILIGWGNEETDWWHHCFIPCGADHFPLGPLWIIFQHTLIILTNCDLKRKIYKLLLRGKPTTHYYQVSDPKAMKPLRKDNFVDLPSLSESSWFL